MPLTLGIFKESMISHWHWLPRVTPPYSQSLTVFPKHVPEDFVSDRGPQFTSWVWTDFFCQLNVNISLTLGYHPQSNGQTERLNQELTRFLRMYCQQNSFRIQPKLFSKILHMGLTPFQCVLGSPLGISISIYPARSSVPGMWVLSQF